MMDYADFLERKVTVDPDTGIEVPGVLNPKLFPFQSDLTRWALRRGRAAIFADCGMGKTPMQLVWAEHVPGPVLILAPLAVAAQTVREGSKFDVPVEYVRDQPKDLNGGVYITNYEMLEHFDPSAWTGIVLDESSIIKHKDGAFRNHLIDSFADTPFKLACTATPAPNDFTELGNHSEFMGVLSMTEMLSTFFVHDGGSTQNWRLKGHAQSDFWRWLCSWAVMLRKPSDIGYDDGDFILPPIKYHDHVVRASKAQEGFLFPVEAQSLQERLSARRETIEDRVAACAADVNASTEPWVVWCNLNDESGALSAAIHGAVEVRGAMSSDDKESALLGFSDGAFRVLVTKPKIAGHGMNWQHCPNVAFVGLSDSWEQYYQAVRRCWRFGQESEVQVHIYTADTEGAVVANIKRKEVKAGVMAAEMTTHMRELNRENMTGMIRSYQEYATDSTEADDWSLYLGDSCEIVAAMAEGSIDYSVFSPPFESLYTYTATDRDIGNCRSSDEFRDHFGFLVKELFRVLKEGRLVSFHCMNLPTSKVRDGVIGLRDFRGDMIRLFQEHGFIYHSEVCIWKDPVTAMQRTKALGLLHKQLKKDACMSRQGIADYLVTMRKPGINPEPVTNTNDSFPVKVWQRYASPVWDDINPSDTLQYRSAREHDDERHICPLQLQVIRRAIRLWTNEGDLVLSPFAGIGSEGYVAIEEGRRSVGVELKRSYYEQACKNMDAAVSSRVDLFTATGASTDRTDKTSDPPSSVGSVEADGEDEDAEYLRDERIGMGQF
jgi:superfamily II DNA or RNA helicase